MKVIIAALFSLFLSGMAGDFLKMDVQKLPEDPDYVCVTNGNQIVIKMGKTAVGSPVDIWQTDVGSDEGIKLSDAKITALLRCPGCFDFVGNLVINDQKVEAKLALRRATLALSYPSLGESQTLTCTSPKK